MTRCRILTLLAALLFTGPRAIAIAGPEFRDLFNRRDLSGWVNVNTADDTWTINWRGRSRPRL
jgi:hypothetical protein